jgi:hypothetical protein
MQHMQSLELEGSATSSTAKSTKANLEESLRHVFGNIESLVHLEAFGKVKGGTSGIATAEEAKHALGVAARALMALFEANEMAKTCIRMQ